MESFIQEFYDNIMSTIIFVISIALAVSFIWTAVKYDHKVRDIVNEKPNVYECNEYQYREVTVPGSSVFYEVLEIDKDVEIDINSHILTEEERDKIAKGTIVYLIDNINFKHNYKRTYYYDTEGNVVKVKYKPAF